MDRKLVERKDILLLTIPVIAGYVGVEFFAIASGMASLGKSMPIFINQFGMCVLFIYSDINAR
ncbi:MAG: hypothetical protein JW908_07185 [Anaerolineales bacterium]|nr:hypothetical protein [Anaerolineales bacterium]